MELSGLFRIETKMHLLLFAFQSKSVKPLLVRYIHSGTLDETNVRRELKAFLKKYETSELLESFKLSDSVSVEVIADFAINIICKNDSLFSLLARNIPLVNRIKSLKKKLTKGNIEKYIESIQCTENDIDLLSTYNAIITSLKLSSSERVLLKLTLDSSSVDVSEMIAHDMKFTDIFLIAIICGSLSALDILWNDKEISEQTKLSLISSNNELTALHFAIMAGNVKAVDWLIRKNFLIDAIDKNGDTGLHLAAAAGHKEIVEMLIISGNSCDPCNADKKTPLHKAASEGHGEIVDVLIRNNANIEAQNASGTTPLIGATENGYRHVVEQLLNLGAERCATNFKGNSCLHRAAFQGHVDIVELILSQGTENVDTQNGDGKTPLHIAAERGHLSVVKLLLEKNANVNSRNSFGQTPLHEAAWKGHSHIVELLLKCGASAKVTDLKNRTALHEAAWNGHIVTVELLLGGSDVNAVDNNNETALNLAEKFAKTAIVELIQKTDC